MCFRHRKHCSLLHCFTRSKHYKTDPLDRWGGNTGQFANNLPVLIPKPNLDSTPASVSMVDSNNRVAGSSPALDELCQEKKVAHNFGMTWTPGDRTAPSPTTEMADNSPSTGLMEVLNYQIPCKSNKVVCSGHATSNLLILIPPDDTQVFESANPMWLAVPGMWHLTF